MTGERDNELWDEDEELLPEQGEQPVLLVPRDEPPVLVVRGDEDEEVSPVEVEDPEQAVLAFLKRLPDIESVGLAHSPGGQVEQIRVICSASREPRHVAREVASLLRAWLGLGFPADAVEVVQLLDPEEDKGRMRLVRCEERPVGAELEVEVTLLAPDTEVKGVARGPRTMQSRTRLAALAAAEAVNRRFESPGLCAAGWADVVSGPDTAMAVALMYLRGRPYSGASLVREGRVLEAVARAALSALNRQLAWPQR